MTINCCLFFILPGSFSASSLESCIQMEDVGPILSPILATSMKSIAALNPINGGDAATSKGAAGIVMIVGLLGAFF